MSSRNALRIFLCSLLGLTLVWPSSSMQGQGIEFNPEEEEHEYWLYLRNYYHSKARFITTIVEAVNTSFERAQNALTVAVNWVSVQPASQPVLGLLPALNDWLPLTTATSGDRSILGGCGRSRRPLPGGRQFLLLRGRGSC